MNSEDPRIDLFIDNEMSEDERMLFLQEMENDVELKNTVLFKQFIVEGIKSEGDEELKEYIKSRVQDESEENQTNLWLYAVATVTVVLVSYFLIIQYIKTGSIKEATEILALNKQSNSESKGKQKYNQEAYVSPVIVDDSTSIYADSSLAVLDENSSQDIDVNIEESDKGAVPTMMDSKGNTAENEKSIAPDISNDPTYQWTFGDDSRYVKNVVLVPIKLTESYVATESMMDKQPMTTRAKIASNYKSKKEASSNEPTINAQYDSVTATESKLKSFANISKFSVVFIDTKTPKQSLEISDKKGSYTIILSNFSSENPLIYHLNGKYYIELGPKTIYSIPLNSIKIDSPKPITDKAIIKAIQN
jgi:hypothetical protein